MTGGKSGMCVIEQELYYHWQMMSTGGSLPSPAVIPLTWLVSGMVKRSSHWACWSIPTTTYFKDRVMDAIVTAALIGTAQRQNIDTITGTAVDKLAEKLPTGDAERSLLLSAGAWAIYRQAGRVADSLVAVPAPSTEETLPACSPEIAALIESLLIREQQQLLPEALERMCNAGLRLPYEMLPTAMAVQETELRASMYHVIGERGRWLSQFNPAWSWVGNYLAGAEDAQLADAETTWQEGTLGQRQAVLRLLRKNDPTKAREWLSAVWKQEKADARTDLLSTLEGSLSAEAEAFLAQPLDDR